MPDFNQNLKTNVCVVCPQVLSRKKLMSAESRLSEAIGLSLAIDLNVAFTESPKIKEIKPATFFSRGFIDNIKLKSEENDVCLMVVDASLTPIQQRNLEKALNLKVIDRTALILEIFGERAQTSEGKLQVTLAHLTYQRSRLVRSWTHLERQRGGAGFLGGPGEKQLELDRRIIDDKIIKIKKELEKVKNTRELQRGNRRKVPYPIVALVGYTNAGKSSLFNRVSGSNVLSENMLFATLDPTLRKVTLPSGKEVIFSDTVGFISDLPHELIMAFRSTLEEVLEADIIVHVRDAVNTDTDLQRADVLEVLHNLGLKQVENSENYIEVLNKSDLLTDEEKTLLTHKLSNQAKSVLSVSALTGEGCANLLKLIDNKLAAQNKLYHICVSADNGKLQSWLYANAEVVNKVQNEDKIEFSVKIGTAEVVKLDKFFGIKL